jgi:hypothetical protein
MRNFRNGTAGSRLSRIIALGRLSEAASRSDAEDNEMLNAAHAAAFHWSKVGTEIHAARVVRSHSRTRFSQMQRPLRMMRRCTPNTTRRRKKWPGLAEC